MPRIIIYIVLLVSVVFGNLDGIGLSIYEEVKLYRQSKDFIVNSEWDAINLARQIKSDGGTPGNICGPLSIAILKNSGLVPEHIESNDFWFLQPRDWYTLETTIMEAFPSEDYLWYYTDIPLNKYNFEKFPLIPGDLIYLYAGGRGTFEHVFVVTRVDIDGRAYAVTNYLTEDGYMISEVMLYDFENPNIGYFYDITNAKNAMTLGVTGYGGFRLWRRD